MVRWHFSRRSYWTSNECNLTIMGIQKVVSRTGPLLDNDVMKHLRRGNSIFHTRCRKKNTYQIISSISFLSLSENFDLVFEDVFLDYIHFVPCLLCSLSSLCSLFIIYTEFLVFTVCINFIVFAVHLCALILLCSLFIVRTEFIVCCAH